MTLVFFPLAFSSTCTTELCTLRDNLAMFKQSGVELIGISVDSKATLRAWAEQEGYDFTLLAVGTTVGQYARGHQTAHARPEYDRVFPQLFHTITMSPLVRAA